MASTAEPALERDRSTWALYLLTGYFAYLETVLGPIMPFVRQEQDIGYTATGFHFGAFAVGGVVAGIVGPRVALRLRLGASLWGGGAGMAAGVVLLLLGWHTSVTVGATLVMGLFGALLLISAQEGLADQHPASRAVVLLESNVVASSCAILSALSVSLFVGIGLGWRAAPALAILGFALLAAGFRRAPLDHARSGGGSTRSARLPPGFWLLSAALFLGVAVEWCFGYWGAGFLVDSGVSPSTAAAALSCFFAAMLAGRLMGSRLARHIDDLALLMATLAVALAGFFVFWLSGGLMGRIAGLILSGAGVSNVYPIVIATAARYAQPHTGLATARLSVAGGSAILIAPAVLGALADRVGLASAYAIVIPLLGISIVVAHAVRLRMAASGHAPSNG